MVSNNYFFRIIYSNCSFERSTYDHVVINSGQISIYLRCFKRKDTNIRHFNRYDFNFIDCIYFVYWQYQKKFKQDTKVYHTPKFCLKFFSKIFLQKQKNQFVNY